MKTNLTAVYQVIRRSSLFLLVLLAPLTALQAAVTTTYSESFTHSQEASAQAEQDWVNFKAGLLPGDYDTVTINGTFDNTGITLTDSTIVPEIAAALKNRTSGSWTAGGHTWFVGTCGANGFESPAYGITVDAAPCGCASPGYIIRPNLGTGNSNWGGVNTATCNGPSQTMTLTFSGSGGPNYNVTTAGCAAIVPGTDDTGNHVDDFPLTSINLPFPVSFYDEVFNSAFVSANGYLVFTGAGSYNFCPPTNAATDLIAPASQDFYTEDSASGQGVFTSVSGVAPDRVFNIEWRVKRCCNFGVPDYNFEMRLYENRQHIDFIYGSNAGGTIAGIGVQRDTGSEFANVACGPPFPAVGTQYSFAEITINTPNIETSANSFNGQVASFTTTRGGAVAGDFTATIDWGDNTTDTATISGGPGTGPYTVTGSHTYASTGFFPITVRVTDNVDGHSDENTSTAGPCDPPPMGMTNWWPGDGNTQDVWGGSNGTLTNGATFGSGEVNQAFSFNGNSQYVDVGFIDVPGTFSVDAWINPTDLSTNPEIICNDDNNNGYDFFVDSIGRLGAIVLRSGGNETLYETNSVVITTGAWQHVAVTYDGNAPNGRRFVFYVNGVAVPAGANADAGGSPTHSNATTKIGTFAANTSLDAFNGLVDEVEIFDCVLSADEIAGLYNAGSVGKCKPSCVAPPANLISWWTADAGAHDIWSGNDGTLKNGASFGQGEVNLAFKFDGVDDYVFVPDSPSLNYTDFTYDAWIAPDPDSPSGDNYIICKGQAGTYLPLIEIRGSAGSHFWQAVVDGGNLFGPAVTYKYQHITVTRSGSVGQLYVDGVLQDTETVGTTASAGYDLNFGQIPGFYSNGSFFKGRLDEVEIFNRALTPNEIAAIYNAHSLGKCLPVCVTPPDNLISWWPGDDTALDIQGSHHGTLQNGATFAPGMVDQAFSLDGVNQFVATNLDAQPSAMPVTTWDAWVYPTAIGPNQRRDVMSTDDGGFDRAVTIEGDGNFGVFIGNTAPGLWEPVAVDLNQWQHIAVVYTPNDTKFYKNGVEYDLEAAATGQGTNDRFTIGSSPGFGEFFQGLIDEVEVFNRALTQSEIQAIYNARGIGKCKAFCMYVSDENSNTIDIFDGNGSFVATFAAAMPSTLGVPTGLSFGPDGRLFANYQLNVGKTKISVGDSSTVQKFDLVGHPTFFANVNLPQGNVFDLTGNLYVAENSTSDIQKFDSSGSGSVFANSGTGVSAPFGVAFDITRSFLFESNNSAGTALGYDLSGNVQQTFNGFNSPTGVAVDVTGNVFVAEASNNDIIRIDTNGNSSVFSSSGLNQPYGLAFDFNGNLYAANFIGDSITKFDAAGNATPFVTSGASHPGFIAIKEISATASCFNPVPDLTATKTNNVGGNTAPGSPWTWKITVANGGNGQADFASGQTILADNLPNTFVIYGSPTVSNVVNVTNSGSISCSIVSNNLTCTASGSTVTIGAGGSFDVSFTTIAGRNGSYVNPRSGGGCSVDPGNVVTESDETNNTCGDTVIVGPTPSPTPTPTPTPSGTPSATPTPTPTPTATPSSTPAPSPTPTPATSPTDVDGDGSINGPHGGQADFQLNVRLQPGRKKPTIMGYVTYDDPGSGVSFGTTRITTLTFNGNQAHIAGSGAVGRRKVNFTLDVTDNGFPGTNDFFSLHLSNGYSASGNVVTGDISIQ